MRDTIFISHATPEDNDFTIWLASRLELSGYKVWIDKEGLLGGEKFWEEIDNVIRNLAQKVILVYSENICYNREPGKLKDGINNEIELSKSIGKKENIKDFIIPCKIDKSEFDLFVGANIYNHIDFEDNWADGLKQLLKKLEKDGVSKNENLSDSTLIDWFENKYITDCKIIDRKELYYSSWWSVRDIPSKFFLHRFENLTQAQAVYFNNKNIPIGKISNVLTSFESKLNFSITKEDKTFDVLPKETFEIDLNKILFDFESDTFPTKRDLENHFKKLLSQVVFLITKNKGLWKYELSNKQFAYYYRLNLLQKDTVIFNFPYRSNKAKPKRKSLIGSAKGVGKWHFAMSAKPILFPVIGFSLKSHLIFSETGFKPIDDKEKMHSLRRAKGKRFFNEEWRDLELAFIQGLRNSDNEISIQVNSNSYIKMSLYPEMFWADFGYIEPKEKMEILYDDYTPLDDL
jgi:hypothetical protein